MLAADAVGGEFVVTNASTSFSDSEISASHVVFGSSGETITISHSREVVETRAAGDDRELFIRRTDADAELIGEVILANQITRGDQANPAIGVASDGSTLAVWSGRGEGDRHGIFARRFNADGSAAGDQFRVNTTRGGEQTLPDVAVADDGSAVVTWHGVGDGDFSGVFAQRIGADDSLMGDEMLVNTATRGMQGYASVGMDNEGNSVVAWSSRNQDGDDWGIFAQRFDTDGTMQGDEIAVNTTTAGSQHQADVDMAADGRFTVAWSSFEQDGDSWGIFAQRFDADGTTLGDEFQVNSDSTGHQKDAALAVSEGGDLLIAWSDGVPDGSGWDVNARTYDADGVADGDIVAVNQESSGAASGHQRNPSIALDANGSSIISFQGQGSTNRNGIVQQRFDVDVEPAENSAPTITVVDAPGTIGVGETLEVMLRAQDPNSRDTLTFELEASDTTPEDATITRVDNNNAILRWTPVIEDRGTRASFRVLVSDDGDPPARDAGQFVVDVVNSAPMLDLNGGAAGIDRTVNFPETGTSVRLLNSSFTLTDNDNTELTSATARLRSFPDLNDESLSVTTTGTDIVANYNAAFGRLELTGTDSLANYEQVLESLRYENTSMPIAGVSRFIEISVNDGTDESVEATITLQIGDNEEPSLDAFPLITLIAGSPLHIPLNGTDPDGDTLTYTAVSTDESLVMPSILQDNRSWRLSIEGEGSNSSIQGDLVFELFEGRARRATEQFIQLTDEGFFDGIGFHRIIENFVIQGGDPEGTGRGGSDLDDFDDQFHVDLQHNRPGTLSMAKSADDTNNSQFFITSFPTPSLRNLDFNHTIFGTLVEGEDLRQMIAAVPTTTNIVNMVPVSDNPVDPITITNAEVFVDNQNGVLVLKAPEGVSGDVNVAVTASDGNGGTVTRTMSVNVVPDSVNGQPFLRDIPTITTSTDTVTTFQLSATDVEGDDVFFFDEARLRDNNQPVLAEAPVDLDFSVDPNSGLLTITPLNGLTGTHQITVGVASTMTPFPGGPIDLQVIDVVINESL